MDIYWPTLDILNRLITKTISAITGSLRYQQEMISLHDMINEYVPFPRLKFMSSSFRLLQNPRKCDVMHCMQSMSEECCSPSHCFVKLVKYIQYILCVYFFGVFYIDTLKLIDCLILILNKINIWHYH